MLSKAKQKYIQSLQRKKIRYKETRFIAEGKKTIDTLLQSNLEVEHMFSVQEWNQFRDYQNTKFHLISKEELDSISNMSQADDGIAIVKIPQETINVSEISEWSILLDQVNDPGNLGTIIRLADWYGIKQIFYTKGTTDPYQPKTVQASMGAIGNITISEVSDDFLSNIELPSFGTVMDGEALKAGDFPKKGILIMGNEANGIRSTILEQADKKIRIDAHPNTLSESLNVAKIGRAHV